MTEIEIRNLVRQIQQRNTEDRTTEVKAAAIDCPKKLYDTFSSFSNQDEGGRIVFGLDEKQKFKVVGVYDPADLQKQINNKSLQMVPPIRPEMSLATIEGMPVVVAEITGTDYCDRPVYYREAGIHKGSYIRIGDSDEHMTAYEIYRYEAYRKSLKEDQRPVVDGWILQNRPLLDQYLLEVKNGRPNLFSHVSDDQILSLNKIEVDSKPSLTGLLVFSKYPQSAFPGLGITAVVVPGTSMGDHLQDGERFNDNQRIEGSLPEMLEETMRFVERNMKHRTIIDESGRRTDRTEYPLRAVREAVLNALIHRDYSRYTEGTPIQIRLFSDRMEIISPGGLYGGFPVSRLGKDSPESRNSTLIKTLEFLKVTENRYSGIPTMKQEMEAAGLPLPEFDDNGRSFTVTFRNHTPEDDAVLEGLSSLQKEVAEFCLIPRSRKEIADHFQKSYAYTSNSILLPMISAGYLLEDHKVGRTVYLITEPDLGKQLRADAAK